MAAARPSRRPSAWCRRPTRSIATGCACRPRRWRSCCAWMPPSGWRRSRARSTTCDRSDSHLPNGIYRGAPRSGAAHSRRRGARRVEPLDRRVSRPKSGLPESSALPGAAPVRHHQCVRHGPTASRQIIASCPRPACLAANSSPPVSAWPPRPSGPAVRGANDRIGIGLVGCGSRGHLPARSGAGSRARTDSAGRPLRRLEQGAREDWRRR